MLPLALTSPTMTLTAAAATATVAVAATTSWYSKTGCQEAVMGEEKRDQSSFRVEVHLMEKIQQKSYLQQTKENIPSTLRLLAVDLPEMRTSAFSGDCQLSHDKIFVDDIAPPKGVLLLENESGATSNKKKSPKLMIAQKALVKSLVQCRSPQSQQRVGVELLEASVADLNPNKLRKTHTFGNFKYDPGKYYGKTSADHFQEEEQGLRNDENVIDSTDVLLSKASHKDEVDAPWNQYAWIDELKLRIGGRVAFGAPMEKASRIERKLFRNAYKETIPSVQKFWQWLLPKFLQSNPDGLDGQKETNCRACNKPHAVIANGAALQRVPTSLKLLQICCKEASVPLFVVHDQRVWGGNTHESLPQALQEMRRTVKDRIIGQALRQQGSNAYARGRMVGQVETEAKWIVKDQKQKAKKFFTQGGMGDRQRRKTDVIRNWSQLDTAALEKKFVEREIIRTSNGKNKKEYSPAMVEIARQCVQDVASEVENKAEAKKPSNAPQSPNNGMGGQSATTLQI